MFYKYNKAKAQPSFPKNKVITEAIYVTGMLERFVIRTLQDISKIIFQLDKAPTHLSLGVRDCSDIRFAERCI